MSLPEDVKRIAEKAIGWKRLDDFQGLLHDRKPQTYQFKDDGLIPNHPKWPLINLQERGPPSAVPRPRGYVQRAV